MTTMFVQLRRMVYLLVLLQCCVCVVSSTGAGERDEATRTKENVERAVKDGYEMLAQGKSCLSLLKKEIEGGNESVLDAKKATEDTVGIVDRIEGKKNDRGQVQILLDEVTRAMGDTKDAVSRATVAVGRIKAANQACHASRGNLGEFLKQFEGKREGLQGYVRTTQDGRQGDMEFERLYQESTKLMGELQNVSAEIFQRGWKGVDMMKEEVKTLEKAIKTLNDAKKKLETLASGLELKGGDGGRNVAIQNVTKVIEEVANNGEVQLKVVSQKPKTDMKGNEVIEGVTVNVVGTLKRVDQQRKQQMVDEAVQLKERIFKGVKEDLQKGEEDEKQRIAETFQAEENAKKERERRVAEEKKKEEERKKIEEQQRRVEEEKMRVEEKKKKADEVKRKDEERKKLEEGKKKIEEQIREAEEEKAKLTEKKMDGAVSPSLVHSPLLLLLLCVGLHFRLMIGVPMTRLHS